MVDHFVGARMRIESAKRHLRTVAAEQVRFFNSSFQWRQELRGGLWLTFIKQMDPMPQEIELSAWDAIQNLRSSLDLAVCAAAMSRGATTLKHTYFHFASDESEWERSLKGRTRAATPETIAIMRAYKPWGGGNEPLYALSRLSAIERHQLVAPKLLANNSIILNGCDALFTGPGSIGIGRHDWDVERGELIITETRYPIDIPIPGYQFTTFIAFGDTPFVGREQFIPIVNSLCDLCTEIVNAIERGAP